MPDTTKPEWSLRWRSRLVCATSSDTNQRWSRRTPADFFLFPRPDGERIQSIRGGFESLLNAAISPEFPNGLKLKDGKNRTLTSIRHTYASKQIEAGATKNGLGFLADNMGTSTEMIRKHYGQALRELRVDDLQNY